MHSISRKTDQLNREAIGAVRTFVVEIKFNGFLAGKYAMGGLADPMLVHLPEEAGRRVELAAR